MYSDDLNTFIETKQINQDCKCKAQGTCINKLTDILAIEMGSKYKYQDWLEGMQKIASLKASKVLNQNVIDIATQTSEYEAMSIRISYDISQQNYPKFSDSKKIYESLEFN